jgi:hypothetical protein
MIRITFEQARSACSTSGTTMPMWEAGWAGTTYLRPSSLLGGRLFQFGAQVDF